MIDENQDYHDYLDKLSLPEKNPNWSSEVTMLKESASGSKELVKGEFSIELSSINFESVNFLVKFAKDNNENIKESFKIILRGNNGEIDNFLNSKNAFKEAGYRGQGGIVLNFCKALACKLKLKMLFLKPGVASSGEFEEAKDGELRDIMNQQSELIKFYRKRGFKAQNDSQKQKIGDSYLVWNVPRTRSGIFAMSRQR